MSYTSCSDHYSASKESGSPFTPEKVDQDVTETAYLLKIKFDEAVKLRKHSEKLIRLAEMQERLKSQMNLIEPRLDKL